MTKANWEITAHVIQDIQPVNPFYTAILVEKKKFTLCEITNSIQPFFFYGSLLAIIVTYATLNLLGKDIPLLFLSSVQIFSLSFLLVNTERAFYLAQLLYGNTGAFTGFKTIIRAKFITKSSKAAESMILQKLWRYLTNSISAWVGQEIYNLTNSYTINIILSLLSNLAALSLLISEALKDTTLEIIIPYKNFNSLSSFADHLKLIYTKEILMGSIVGGSAACLQIYISIFSQTLFREKNEDFGSDDKISNIIISKILYVLHLPIYFVSYLIVRLFCFFSSSFKIADATTKKSKISAGYIEGTAKLLSATGSMFIIKYTPLEWKENAYFTLFGLSIVFFVSLGNCKSIAMSKILYLLAFTAIASAENMAKSYLHRSPDYILLLNISMLFETIIHSAINYICKLKGHKVAHKSKYYSAIGCLAFLIAIYFKLAK
jgi:hypothetical protein